MTKHVAAVIPVFNRPDDLRHLLADLDGLDDADCTITTIVVDNASDPPVDVHPGVVLERLDVNTGGSGGFNAGMRRALAIEDVDLVWLLDSDVRVPPGTLRTMLSRLAEGHDVVGAVLCDPSTGEPYEFGGRLDRTWGHYASIPSPSTRSPEYIAACCMLVQRDTLERVGGFPDLFLNCDDVAWGLHAHRHGSSLAIATSAHVTHPPGIFPGGARYHQARNAFVPIEVAGLGPMVRLRRSFLEIGRAFGLVLMGRKDLALAHATGLRDAARGRTVGRGEPPSTRAVRAPEELVPSVLAECGSGPGLRVETSPSMSPIWDDLGATLGASLRIERSTWTLDPGRPVRRQFGLSWRAVCRALFGRRLGHAIVVAREDATVWAPARTTWYVTRDGWWVHRAGRTDLLQAILLVLPMLVSALRVVCRRPRAPEFPDLRCGTEADTPPAPLRRRSRQRD